MTHEAVDFGVEDEQGRKVAKAEIARSEVMFGNIRIKCPFDNTEHEVSAGTEKFICPIGQDVLLIDV